MPTTEQLRQLRIALISAFPDRQRLEQMLFFRLGKNLNQLVPDSNLETIVSQLIRTAQAQGWLIVLVRAARQDNPGNSELEAIADELILQDQPEPPRNPINLRQKILVLSASVIVVFVLIVEVTRLPIFDDLSSKKGVDYTQLRDFLKAGNWKQADYETYLVMPNAADGKDGELLNFSCTDLRTIDTLWVKYSNGRFGFSVQKKIYSEVNGKLDGEYHRETWETFGESVGWLVRGNWIEDVQYDTEAPSGHLPNQLGHLPNQQVNDHLSLLMWNSPSSTPFGNNPSMNEYKFLKFTRPRYFLFLFSRIQTCKVNL